MAAMPAQPTLWSRSSCLIAALALLSVALSARGELQQRPWRGSEDGNGTADVEERRLASRHASARLYYSMPSGSSTIGSWFNVLVPKHSAADTYFSVLSHNKGYMGLQQIHWVLGFRGRVVFSIWDRGCSGVMDPEQCPEADRAMIVECGEKAVCKRFGNEGTGVQTYVNFNEWNVETPYGFLVRASSAGVGRVLYEGYFHAAEMGGWVLVGKIETPISASSAYIGGIYSFVEHFTDRNFEDMRWGRFGPSFIRPSADSGSWTQVRDANLQVTSGAGEVATHIKANVTNGGQQWGMSVDMASQGSVSGRTLHVNRAEPPASLLEFDQLAQTGELPGGCRGGTCSLTGVEALLMNHLGIILFAILPGLLLISCVTCYFVAPKRIQQKLRRRGGNPQGHHHLMPVAGVPR